MANPTRTHAYRRLFLCFFAVFLWSSCCTISAVSSFKSIGHSSVLRERLRASRPIHGGLHGHANLQSLGTYKSPPSPSSSSSSSSLDSFKRRALEDESGTAATNPGPTKSKPLVIRWLVGIALGLASGFVTAILFSAAFRLTRKCLGPKKSLLRPVVYQRSIDSKSIAFLQNDDALEGLEVLGKGATGAVYKTTLVLSTTKSGHPSTKAVAIKKVHGLSTIPINPKKQHKRRAHPEDSEDNYLNTEGSDIDILTKHSAQIRAEMDTLGHVRHRNLVTLLAYVPRPNAHLLIYDFMANGSLSDILNKVRVGALDLGWSMRYDIALGVAKGLKYLHHDAKPKIIHRDLKPANILLDETMEAHIGDFGLAKLLVDDATHVTGSNWAGTPYYVAPEYANNLKYTDKGDIYAFGVVLVVLLTNRQPSEDMFINNSNYIGGWVVTMLEAGPESILGVLDERLLGQGFEEQLLLTFRIASFCLAMSPNARPSSIDVLEMLYQITK